MDVNSSSAGPNQASDYTFHGTFSLSNKQWEALNLPLSDTPQISFTQFTDFNTSSDIPITPHRIPISSPEVPNISTTLKVGVWKYSDKVTVDGGKRVKCKLCPDVSYVFHKNVRTDPLS